MLCACACACVCVCVCNLSFSLQNVGVDKNSHLNLRQVPEDLLPALESHLKEMDAIRKAAAHQQPR